MRIVLQGPLQTGNMVLLDMELGVKLPADRSLQGEILIMALRSQDAVRSVKHPHIHRNNLTGRIVHVRIGSPKS